MQNKRPVSPPALIAGVDFSGAQTAGKKIWICAGVPHDGILRIEECFAVAEKSPRSIPVVDASRFLRQWIAGLRNIRIGLDFPFALPAAIQGDQWAEFVENFAVNFPDPDTFRKACRQASPHQELKRPCENHASVPFSSYNLRLYRQTYHGISQVLAPLLKNRSACLIPYQSEDRDLPQLLEACPASWLKRKNIYRPYKGRSDRHRQQRHWLLRMICEMEQVSLPTSLMEKIINNSDGDALDSLIAAIIVFTLPQKSWPFIADPPDAFRQEGIVYF